MRRDGTNRGGFADSRPAVISTRGTSPYERESSFGNIVPSTSPHAAGPIIHDIGVSPDECGRKENVRDGPPAGV